ncbi:unnamed protein product [Closterium sp. Naga37s-1]|nr:unnamed protein product [Closterium sp. Naga37s-1]
MNKGPHPLPPFLPPHPCPTHGSPCRILTATPSAPPRTAEVGVSERKRRRQVCSFSRRPTLQPPVPATSPPLGVAAGGGAAGGVAGGVAAGGVSAAVVAAGGSLLVVSFLAGSLLAVSLALSQAVSLLAGSLQAV